MYLDYEAGGLLIIFWLVYVLFMLGIGVAAYVLKALGMDTIAKRRGIKKPWLVWIPVAEMWTLGCISDQYQYVVKGKVKNKRKSLLTLNILMWVAYVAFLWLMPFLRCRCSCQWAQGFKVQHRAD